MREQGQRRSRAKTQKEEGDRTEEEVGEMGRYYKRSTGRSHELAQRQAVNSSTPQGEQRNEVF